MNAKQQTRNVSLDVIRCFALLCVVGVHFFLRSGFYSEPVKGMQMYFMMLLRSFFIICVPLFMTLTGYLECHKKISASYYKKIIRILAIYALCSVACVLYNVFGLKSAFELEDFFFGFLSYSNAPYSWYVEMYIGLFMLIPFLNVLYMNLETKKQKQLLLFTMIFLTSLPSSVNIFKFELEWFLNPASSRDYVQLLPDFFKKMYPITYYFMGCYLREYKPKLKSRYIFLMTILFFVLNGSFNYYRAYGDVFISTGWQDYFGFAQVVMTYLVFSFFISLDYSKISAFASKTLKSVSNLCFGAYLSSWVFDKAFYKILEEKVQVVSDRYVYFVPMVAAVFVCSVCLSGIIDVIYRFLEWICKKIIKIIKGKTPKQPQDKICEKNEEIFAQTP